MAINLTTKFQKATSEAVKAGAKTGLIVNDNWDWDGANAIKIYTLTTPTIGDYAPAGASNRYGTPTEVQDTIQTWTLSRDRSYSAVMDALNVQDTNGVRRPAEFVAQTLREKIIPKFLGLSGATC